MPIPAAAVRNALTCPDRSTPTPGPSADTVPRRDWNHRVTPDTLTESQTPPLRAPATDTPHFPPPAGTDSAALRLRGCAGGVRLRGSPAVPLRGCALSCSTAAAGWQDYRRTAGLPPDGGAAARRRDYRRTAGLPPDGTATAGWQDYCPAARLPPDDRTTAGRHGYRRTAELPPDDRTAARRHGYRPTAGLPPGGGAVAGVWERGGGWGASGAVGLVRGSV
ncbi:hypothetical protein GCM10011578_023550 [Streptomyces fuscichromogenes]|uniref:Uncharacterized protein n=1 Tax=Streptomyces fuscichromogenes TaxID=1324013 RepID=A0A918CQT3_9ACTN|nr:hypothetical protein GCM10011578_023550 [Streptomyces fuscichromogenes]